MAGRAGGWRGARVASTTRGSQRPWFLALCAVLALVAQLTLAACGPLASAPTPSAVAPAGTVSATVTPASGAPTATTAPATSTAESPFVATAAARPTGTRPGPAAATASPGAPGTVTRAAASPATPVAASGRCAFAPPFSTPTGGPAARATPAPTVAPGATAPRPDPTPPTIPLPNLAARYSFTIDEVRFETGHLRAHETVQITNRENCALDRLYLSVVVARWGWFTLDGLQIDGQPAAAALDGTVLSVALLQLLGPAATVTLVFDFHLDVGTANDPFTPGGFAGTTRAGDILRLAYWFPILSDDHQYPPFLDPPYTATADYDVTLTSPANLVVAATGVVSEERATGDTITRRISAPNVRDFVLNVSPNYQVARRTTANGVVVEVYYSPLNLDPLGQNPAHVRAQIDAALAAGVLAIERLSTLIGPYPYPVFRIVDGGPRLGGGIEYPMVTVVNLGGRSLSELVYHETAHEWFYGILGTRTQQDPWIDEGGASFLAAYLGGSLATTPAPARDFTYRLSTSVWEIPPGASQPAAYRAIYDQGEAFYNRVRLAMGEEAFWAALQALYRDQRYGIITPRDLLTHWQAASAVDLRPVFHDYLDYPWLDELTPRR